MSALLACESDRASYRGTSWTYVIDGIVFRSYAAAHYYLTFDCEFNEDEADGYLLSLIRNAPPARRA